MVTATDPFGDINGYRWMPQSATANSDLVAVTITIDNVNEAPNDNCQESTRSEPRGK